MANSLSASFPKVWAKVQQEVFDKTDIFRAICSFKEEPGLTKGNIVDRPYRSALTTNTLGSEGSYTRQDVTDVTDTLTVSTGREVSFYVRDPDKMQSNYNTIKDYARDAAVALGNWIDGDVLGEYENASSVVGNYELGGGGSSGDGIGITAATGNVLKIFATADMKLNSLNIPQDKRFAAISSHFKQTLLEYLAGKESTLGDSTGQNGHIGKYYGFDLYISNSVGWSGRLEMATIAVDTDTIVINGVTFYADADGAAAGAGRFSIQATAALCCAQLVDAINNEEGYAAGIGTVDTYIEVTAANRAKLKGIVATDGGTYLTLKSEGRAYIAVSETLSPPANIWTTTKQLEHQLFGRKGAIDVVVQKDPSVETFHRDGYVGSDVVQWIYYGLQTFNNMKAELVDVQIRSDAY